MRINYYATICFLQEKKKKNYDIHRNMSYTKYFIYRYVYTHIIFIISFVSFFE